MKKLFLLAIPIILLGLGCRSTDAPDKQPQDDAAAQEIAQLPQHPIATYFNVKEGDRFSVGDLAFEIEAITSLTADGCDGGPIGCPDSIDLLVFVPRESQKIRLVVLNGEIQNASSERIIFGHKIVLAKVTETNATLGVFIAENPILPPTSR